MNAFLILALVVGIALVRAGWAWHRPLALFGWGVTAVALVALGCRSGAWGLALGTVAGMAVALAALSGPGGRPPTRPRRVPPDRPADGAAPGGMAPARRLAVFVLVMPVGGVAALWLGFGIQAAARRAGMATADANAGLWLLLPALWTILLVWQMMRDGPRQMAVPPLLAAGLGTALWAVR